MKVFVTGGTGYIGTQVVTALLRNGHQVTVISRNEDKARKKKWFNQVKYISCNLHTNPKEVFKVGFPDCLIHLSWPGLPHYYENFHLEKNLVKDIDFFNWVISQGIKHIIVSGTCLEYGRQFGQVKEDSVTIPETPYGIAKDTLRKYLELKSNQHKFTLQWLRIFYSYGPGQNDNSLMSQLDKAINEGAKVFNMSQGEQLMDYLGVEQIGSIFSQLVDIPECNGVINCSSGKPISIRKLIEDYLKLKDIQIKLNLGYYPYREYESMGIWGSNEKIKNYLPAELVDNLFLRQTVI